MKLIIDLTNIKTYELFDEILSVDRKTNLFKDLRKFYAGKVQEAILVSGIKKAELTDNVNNKLNLNSVQLSPIPSLYNNEILDIDFCSGYGVGYYSLGAVSYQHRPFEQLPSLDTFLKRKNFSIGNFGFWVDNGDYEIEIVTDDSIMIVGYSFQINPKKRKSFIAIFGVHFEYNSILRIAEKYKISEKHQLLDVKLSTVNYPAIFMCRISGEFFVCNCFKDYINWKWDFERFANIYEPDILARVKRIQYIDGICHYCNKTTPHTEVEMSGYSSFLSRYAPYYKLECKKRYGDIFHFIKEDNTTIENELRQHFGYPKIGEKWISETYLYYIIKDIFNNHNILFHYRGSEMEGLELDIFIPELKLGVEYQGQQHYQLIEHWGGSAGLEKRIYNDKMKIELCKKNGYTLVEFSFKDDLNRDLVIERIEKLALTTTVTLK